MHESHIYEFFVKKCQTRVVFTPKPGGNKKSFYIWTLRVPEIDWVSPKTLAIIINLNNLGSCKINAKKGLTLPQKDG